LKSQSEESVLKQRLHVQTLEAKLEKMQKENQDKAAQLRKVDKDRRNEFIVKWCKDEHLFVKSMLFLVVTLVFSKPSVVHSHLQIDIYCSGINKVVGYRK